MKNYFDYMAKITILDILFFSVIMNKGIFNIFSESCNAMYMHFL